jgi:DNA-binding HxlR family transcriptional regulator
MPKPNKCPADRTLSVIGGRWKILILWHLFQGTKRFNQLHRGMPGVSQKVLTQQLRELERDGVVHREVFAEVPPKVEYSLTPLGATLRPVVEAMCQWGLQGDETCDLDEKSKPDKIPQNHEGAVP